MRSLVHEPDYVVVLDSLLRKSVNITEGLRESGILIINSSVTPDQIELDKRVTTATVDATGIALEVLDTTIMAYKIAEHKDVNLPVAIGLDGYILSYTAEPVEIPNQEDVDKFLPPFKPATSLAEPLPYGEWVKAGDVRLYGTQKAWITHHEKMNGSKKIIQQVDKEFGEKFGRSYGGLYEEYKCEKLKR